MALFWCCAHISRVHPLENILDFHDPNLISNEGDFTSEQSTDTYTANSKTEHDSVNINTTVFKMELTQMSRSQLDCDTLRAIVTPLHAAAINGDKSSLVKLLMSSTSQDLNSGDKFGRTALIYTVLGDRIECAKLLLKAGCNVNQKDSGGRTALHWSAYKGHYKCLKLLISRGGNCKEKDNELQTPLHLSTRHKSARCLELLIRQLEVGEVDDQENNKRTALHWAASYGNLEHVKLLIKQHSNIGIPDTEGKTPLHWAASCKESQAVECVRLILETSPSVMNWQDFEGLTALHLAVADGNEAVVNILRSFDNCNVSALDNLFRTPLHWAAALGHSRIVAMLFDRKVDWASSDSNGAFALHYAAQNNFSETVEAILSRKGVKDEPDLEGRTAFMWAAGKGADDVIRVFIRRNVDLGQRDKNGVTALHAAAQAGHVSTVQLLLAHKACIESEDDVKHTPLFRACEIGHLEVLHVLIEAGARTDIVDQDGRSPLHWAALGGHAFICQMLLKYGIDPDVVDLSGRTPLHCAAYGGYVNCMSVLIEHKADRNIQDNEGMTCVHWACSRGHLDAIKLLVEHRTFINHINYTEERYTPLDYALMGEHYDVSQYMMEHGALSITGIQGIVALKIQAVFRGYRVRKTFLERKMLLVKHEKLKKDAAKKRAEEKVLKKSGGDNCALNASAENFHQLEASKLDSPTLPAKNASTAPAHRSLKTALNRLSLPSKTTPITTSPSEDDNTAPNVPTADVPNVPTADVPTAKLPNSSSTGNLHSKSEMARKERRLVEFRRKVWAARVIQRTWRSYVRNARSDGIARGRGLREMTSEETVWCRQMAALTIQLAWRKYYRKKVLKSLTPKNRRMLRICDPQSIVEKQKALVDQIYGEQMQIREWHPKLSNVSRPPWFKILPSPAEVSYNFAVNQYYPRSEKFQKLEKTNWPRTAQYVDVNGELGHLRISESFQPGRFSYNTNKLNS